MRTATRLTTAALLLALGVPAFAWVAQDTPRTDNVESADVAEEAIRADDAADDEDDNGLFADPEPGDGEDAPARRVEGEDLPIGDTLEVDADQATYRYHAQGPGMLTVLVHAPGERTRVQIQVKDARGRPLPGGVVNGNNANNFGPRLVVDANGNPVGQLPGLAYLAIPLSQAGDYQIEMSVAGETDGPIQIGGAWVGFEQIAAPIALIAPVAPAPPPPAFDPTDVAEEIALGDSAQPEIDGETNNGWIKLTADDAGTLVVVTNAEDADVRLAVFADGQFADSVAYVDSDRQGDVGREALMFHSDAGEIWYIRVTARGAEHVPVRTAFIADDLEEADPQDGNDDQAADE